MNVIIIGQQWLASQLLAHCLDRGDTITMAVSTNAADSFIQAASAAGIPTLIRQRLDATDIPAADIILCAHAHTYITAPAIAKTRLGALGYHPSLLPKHRGRDAIRWAIHMREPITGGSLYWLTEQTDAGPIAAQDWCWIHPNDTPQTLWRRDLAPMGLRLFDAVLRLLDTDVIPSKPQPEHLATFEPAFGQVPFKQLHLNSD